jgi:uncharacterized protein
VRIVRRDEVSTPWAVLRGKQELVLYELEPVLPLAREIVNKDDVGSSRRMGIRRWSSRLALERARTLGELFLESEPEWRLYEELRARGVKFQLRVQPPKLRAQDGLRGRVWFVLDEARSAAWTGAAGFVLRDRTGGDLALASVAALVEVL